MSNYKKFSIETIKKKLKNGDYAEAVGAMRAIGKTQELSDDEKEKARVMVRKHFGIEATAPKAKRVAKKTRAKKAAAKPKAVRAAKATKPVAAPKKAVAKKAAKKTRRSKAAATEEDTGASSLEVAAKVAPVAKPPVLFAGKSEAGPGVLTMMGQVISTVGDSLKAMEAAKRMFPKASFERDVEVATGVMARAVRTIDQEVVGPRLNSEAASAPATTRKKAAKKGTRAKANVPAQEEPETEVEAEVVANGVSDESNLSEEEQEQLRLARASQPEATA